MDIKSKQKRSENMAKIKCADTKPELYIRSLLHRNGLRYRLHSTAVPGKPDLYFPGRKTAVFVHGCYWHRHQGCRYAYTPKSNVEFWVKKLEGNRQRDETVRAELLTNGYRVLVIWECTIRRMQKDAAYETQACRRIMGFLDNPAVTCLEL